MELKNQSFKGNFGDLFNGTYELGELVTVEKIKKEKYSRDKFLIERNIYFLSNLSECCKGRCKNLLYLIDHQKSTEEIFIITERYDGNLEELLDRGKLDESTLRLVLRQICLGMNVLKSKGIIHRDLKPSNIIFCYKDDEARNVQSLNGAIFKISGFNHAKFFKKADSLPDFSGTPIYMAPEFHTSSTYGFECDIWSIGVMLYECFTLEFPFSIENFTQLEKFYKNNQDLSSIV